MMVSMTLQPRLLATDSASGRLCYVYIICWYYASWWALLDNGPWFDKECRAAKRSTRRLERAFSAASRRAAIATTFADCNATDAVAEAAAAKTAWYQPAPFLSSVATQQVCWVLARQTGSQSVWSITNCGKSPTTYSAVAANLWAPLLTLKYRYSTSFYAESCQSEIKHCWCSGADVHSCATWCLVSALSTADDWQRHQCYSATPWQHIGCWSHSNISVEADCRFCRAIRHRIVQPVAVHWSLPGCVERGVHHSNCEEVRTWCDKREFVSSDFELVCSVKASGAPCRSPADGVYCRRPILCRLYSLVTDRDILLKLLYSGCFQTFSRPLTMVIWLLWFF